MNILLLVIRIVLYIALLSLPPSSRGQFESPSATPFVAVFINDQDVRTLGDVFPLPRRYLADAIRSADKAGAKGLVLKFFVDLAAKVPADDEALVTAIEESTMPVILQANLERSGDPVVLPEKFYRNDLPILPHAPSGNRGWLPLPVLAEQATAVGFIDSLIPPYLSEVYRGRPVPSLFLASLELALGRATFDGDSVQFANVARPFDLGKVGATHRIRDDLEPLSLQSLLDGSASSQIRGKVVVLGYDGLKMHTFPTASGDIKAHRLFYYQLQYLFGAIIPSDAPQ